jgi:hypothetical protein
VFGDEAVAPRERLIQGDVGVMTAAQDVAKGAKVTVYNTDDAGRFLRREFPIHR